MSDNSETNINRIYILVHDRLIIQKINVIIPLLLINNKVPFYNRYLYNVSLKRK